MCEGNLKIIYIKVPKIYHVIQACNKSTLELCASGNEIALTLLYIENDNIITVCLSVCMCVCLSLSCKTITLSLILNYICLNIQG